MKGIACAGAVVLLFTMPAAAHADRDVFEVDTISDLAGLTACTNAAGDCSLRGAIANANDGDANHVDEIVFDDDIFDGVETTPGEATIVLNSTLDSDEALTLDTTCSNTHPCVGIDGPFSGHAISQGGSQFTMSGVAIFDSGSDALFLNSSSANATLANNWFGLKLDGTVEGNDAGVTLLGSGGQIGTPGGAPNVFAGNETGLTIFGSSNNHTVRGNLFGVKRDGTLAPNTGEDIAIAGNTVSHWGPSFVTIGGNPNDTPECDGRCNVIAAAGSGSAAGISMLASVGTASTADDIEISGNYIGLNEAGTEGTASAAQSLVAIGDAGSVSVSDNHLAGGIVGVSASPEAVDPVIEGNTIGTNPAGTAFVDGATVASVSVESHSNPNFVATINGNLITPDPSATGILLSGLEGTVEQNQIGLPGVAASGGMDGIGVDGTGHLIANNTIYKTTGDGIRVEGNGSDFNTLRRNLGTGTGDLFIDLVGREGFGNGMNGPNRAIRAPAVTGVERLEITGTGQPGATVIVYRTGSADGEDPKGLSAVIGTRTVRRDRTWTLVPASPVNANFVITALQTDGEGNTSELAKAQARE